MKRLLSLLFLISITLTGIAQTVSPREGNTGGRSKVYNPTISTRYITDSTSPTDTVMISPQAHENWYFINTGDTLKGCVCIGLKDTTINGRTKVHTDDYCFRGDKMFINFTTTGLKVDTIKFYGNIECDTLGSANKQIRVIKKDTNKTSHLMEFFFDGTKYIEKSVYAKPANASDGR